MKNFLDQITRLNEEIAYINANNAKYLFCSNCNVEKRTFELQIVNKDDSNKAHFFALLSVISLIFEGNAQLTHLDVVYNDKMTCMFFSVK